MSSLFGFHAAADEEITQLTTGPVRVFSVASPFVGNAKFLLAFQALERVKRLQHLRIANAEDIVTHMPFVAPKLGLVSPIMALAQGGGKSCILLDVDSHLMTTVSNLTFTL